MGLLNVLLGALAVLAGYLYATVSLPEHVMRAKARAFVRHLNADEVDAALDLLAAEAEAVVTWHSMEPVRGRGAIARTYKELRGVLAAGGAWSHEVETVCGGRHCVMLTQQAYQVAEQHTMAREPFGFFRDCYLYFSFTEELEIDLYSEVVDLQQLNRTRSVEAVDAAGRALGQLDAEGFAAGFAEDVLHVDGDSQCVGRACVQAEAARLAAVAHRFMDVYYQHAVAGRWVVCRALAWADLDGQRALEDPELRDSMLWMLPRFSIARGFQIFHLNDRFEIDVWINAAAVHGLPGGVLDKAPYVPPADGPTALEGSGWTTAAHGWWKAPGWSFFG